MGHVLDRVDLPVGVGPGDQVPAGVRHHEVHGHARTRQEVLHALPEGVQALPGAGGDRQGPGQAGAQGRQGDGVGQVGLVEHHELGDVQGAGDTGQDGVDGGDLAQGVGVGGVHDVEEQVGAGDLLQGGAEGLNELVGQVAYESDGVGQGVDAPVGGLGTPDRGIQGGEQGVLDHGLRPGEAVHEGGLAGVGVAGNGHRGDGPAPS